MPVIYEDTGAVFELIETDNINKVPFKVGQYIIVDDGMVYYDPTTGSSINDRACLTPKNEVDVNDRAKNSAGEWLTDDYYLGLCTNPIDNDVNIIRTLIEGTDKKEYTIYIYNKDKWIKLNQSYNAKNVYLDDNITVTIPLGNDKLNIPHEVNTKGLSVFDALNAICGPEIKPEIIEPSIEVSFDPDIKFLDYGSSNTINYDVKLNPGKYEYGPDTGVTVTKYSIKDSKGITRTSKSNSFDVNNVTDSYYIDFNIEYSEGVDPNSNLPNKTLPGENIKAGIITKRFVFESKKADLIFGYLTAMKPTLTKYDIESCNKEYIEDKKTFDLKVPANTAEIYILKPVKTKILSVINKNTNYDMFNAFHNETGSNIYYYGNDQGLYSAYVYKPANNFTTPVTLSITIEKGE